MIQENELATMLIGIWIFLYTRRINFTKFPEYRYFLGGFYCLLLSWVFTVFEAFFLGDFLNFVEHFFYALSSALLTIWCLKVIVQKDRGKL
jgi:hypothetical protein